MPLVRGLDLLAFSNVGERGLTAVHPNDSSVSYLHGSSKEPEWAVGYLERARAGIDVLHGTLELVRRGSFPGSDGRGRRYPCGRWRCLLHLSECWNRNECHAQHDAGSHTLGARNRTTKHTIDPPLSQQTPHTISSSKACAKRPFVGTSRKGYYLGRGTRF